MDLFEYQARDLFESHQIPVLAGAVATTADQAFSAAEKIGGKVVVKAQVKVGGRGKAGGVKVAENAADAKDKAGAILLFYIAYKLYGDILKDNPEKQAKIKKSQLIKENDKKNYWKAIFTIIVADMTISFDNVIAVAGAAKKLFTGPL